MWKSFLSFKFKTSSWFSNFQLQMTKQKKKFWLFFSELLLIYFEIEPLCFLGVIMILKLQMNKQQNIFCFVFFWAAIGVYSEIEPLCAPCLEQKPTTTNWSRVPAECLIVDILYYDRPNNYGVKLVLKLNTHRVVICIYIPDTVFPHIVSSLEYFPPLNSFLTSVRKLFKFFIT